MNASRTHTVTDAQRSNPLKVPDSRLLWLGEGISVFGDHFCMIVLSLFATLLPAVRQMGLEVNESEKKKTIVDILRSTEDLPSVHTSSAQLRSARS